MFAFVQTGCVSLRKGTVERCPEEETGSLKGGEKAWVSRQVSRGSAGEYQADEQAGVARLSWRVSGR